MNNSILILLATILLLSACTRPIDKVGGKTEINVPPTCLDQSGKFTAIKTIITRLSYNEKPKKYQPIRNSQGFITHDFNKDKINDYLFIERNQALIKFVSCMSHADKYQRKQTSFTIHEEKNTDFQTIYESIRFQNGLLYLSINKHEHNWGSDSETKTFRFNQKYNDFILIKQEILSSSGDGMRSDTEEVYNLDKQRYQQKQTCGFSEEGCSSQQIKTGRIILPKNRASLYQPGKIYERLVAD